MFRFLIFDAPNDDNLALYIHELKKHHVKHLVRACDPTYSVDPLKKEGIQVHDMPFPDGGAPSDSIVDNWLELLHSLKNEADRSGASGSAGGPKITVAVHCVAGLGRAPVLVALALIDGGMAPLQAVEFIREKRRGSINMKQLQYLKNYKPRRKGGCIIM